MKKKVIKNLVTNNIFINRIEDLRFILKNNNANFVQGNLCNFLNFNNKFSRAFDRKYVRLAKYCSRITFQTEKRIVLVSQSSYIKREYLNRHDRGQTCRFLFVNKYQIGKSGQLKNTNLTIEIWWEVQCI